MKIQAHDCSTAALGSSSKNPTLTTAMFSTWFQLLQCHSETGIGAHGGRGEHRIHRNPPQGRLLYGRRSYTHEVRHGGSTNVDVQKTDLHAIVRYLYACNAKQKT